NPSIHAICCSIADPTRAPAGMHTIKIVAYQPYELKEGPQHWDEIQDQVADANLRFLRAFASTLTDDKILARIVKSPLDPERLHHVTSLRVPLGRKHPSQNVWASWWRAHGTTS